MKFANCHVQSRPAPQHRHCLPRSASSATLREIAVVVQYRAPCPRWPEYAREPLRAVVSLGLGALAYDYVYDLAGHGDQLFDLFAFQQFLHAFAGQRRGFERVKVNGELYLIGEAPKLDKKLKHDIEAVIDRIVVREGIASRLADSFETALGLSDGIAYAENADTKERTVFSAKFACPVSGFTI